MIPVYEESGVPVNGATGTGGQRLEWQWHNVELPIFDGV
jgi:hypothetical protein